MIRRTALIALGGALLFGCGSYSAPPPRGFVELARDARYDQRAVTADGVVFATRNLPNRPRGPLEFWQQVLRERLQRAGGYELLEEHEVHAASGEAGCQLRFGREEQGQPYVYWVTLFVDGDRLLLVEAGGQRERFALVEEDVERAMSGVRLR